MADETCGSGYVDGNSTSASTNTTYCDTAYPATGEFTCDTIDVNIAVAGGGDWVIGHGSLSGTTFTPKHTVTVTTASTGVQQFTAPGDFTAFVVDAGDFWVCFSSSATCQPDRTTTPNPKGYGVGGGGDETGEASFTVSLSDTRSIEIQLSGPSTAAQGSPGGRMLLGVG